MLARENCLPERASGTCRSALLALAMVKAVAGFGNGEIITIGYQGAEDVSAVGRVVEC